MKTLKKEGSIIVAWGLKSFAARLYDPREETYNYLIKLPYISKNIEFSSRSLSVVCFYIKDMTGHYWDWMLDTVTQCEIYGWYSATDCDHYHVEYAVSYKNRRAWDDAMEHLHDDAEGPVGMYRISKEEYEASKSKPVCRDYMMEAHEDGHPYNVER